MKCVAARLCGTTMSAFAIAGADEAPSLSPASRIVWVPVRGASRGEELTLSCKITAAPAK